MSDETTEAGLGEREAAGCICGAWDDRTLAHSPDCHPATPDAGDASEGLSEAEREGLYRVLCSRGDSVRYVERIVAAREAAARAPMAEVLAELDRAGRHLQRVLSDPKVKHIGSDPTFLAVHDAQNALARAAHIARSPR